MYRDDPGDYSLRQRDMPTFQVDEVFEGEKSYSWRQLSTYDKVVDVVLWVKNILIIITCIATLYFFFEVASFVYNLQQALENFGNGLGEGI